jgi:hypothetical protein
VTFLVLVLLAAPLNAPLALATIAALGRPPNEVDPPEPRALPTVAGRLILDAEVPAERLVLRIDGIDGEVAPDGSFSFRIPEAGVHTLDLHVDWDLSENHPIARWSDLEFYAGQTLRLPPRDLRGRVRGMRIQVVDAGGRSLAGRNVVYGRIFVFDGRSAETDADGCVRLARSDAALPSVWISGGQDLRDVELSEVDGDRRVVLLPRPRVRCVLDASVPLPRGSRHLLPTITARALRRDWNWRFTETLRRLQQTSAHFRADREVLLRLPGPGEYRVELWVMDPTWARPLANAYGVVEAVPGVRPARLSVPETEGELRLVITVEAEGLRYLEGLGRGGR